MSHVTIGVSCWSHLITLSHNLFHVLSIIVMLVAAGVLFVVIAWFIAQLQIEHTNGRYRLSNQSCR